MSDTISVVMADDHPAFRAGVAAVLRADSSIQVLGEASDGEQALSMLRRLKPRVALLDVDMPKRDGLAVVRELLGEGSDIAFVLLTMYGGEVMLREALELGVRGYVSKESATNEIVACVQLVAAGRTYISTSFSISPSVGTSARFPAPGLAELTETERTVLRMIARNHTTREIAEALSSSPKTVEKHRSNICQKLGVTGNNALMRYALDHARELQSL